MPLGAYSCALGAVLRLVGLSVLSAGEEQGVTVCQVGHERIEVGCVGGRVCVERVQGSVVGRVGRCCCVGQAGDSVGRVPHGHCYAVG